MNPSTQSAIDEREDVQKKTFGKWINSMLAKGNFQGIQDVFTDLRDGNVLLNLLEVLTKSSIKREKGRMRVHHLNNVSRALELLKEQKVRLVNISNNEIVDGNNKITLALAWSIFLHWQVNDIMKELMASTHQSNLEKALLQWCQQNTQPYPGVEIKNFSTCWSDGRAFAALVHRFKPDSVNYGSIANMNIMNRLDTIFNLCHEHLGIERLLDPEDVNTSVPDKKSVMMYVMCLFQALTCDSLEPPPLPQTTELEASIEHESNVNADGETKEIASYNSIVEEVLGWLLQANDVAEKFGEVQDDLAVVKNLFQEHERFMLNLTEHQADVGEVLQEGSRLLTELKLKPDEIEHVKLQMKILNDKWEELRIASMTRQNLIHEKLMSLQLSELSSLRDFLTQTEDEMSKLSDMKFHFETVRQRHQDLSKKIIEMQSRVISLSDLVLVVDSSNEAQGDDAAAESTLEDQLQGLSERWSVICNWTEKRSKLLSKVQDSHDRWENDSQRIGAWLKNIELQLMNNEALGDERDIALTSQGNDSILQRYEQLQRLQIEMEEKLTEINALTAESQDVNAEFNDPYHTELLMDKWGVVSEILQAQSHRMSKYSQYPVSQKSRYDDFMDVSILQQVVHQDEPKAKRLKTLTWLNENKQNLMDWIDRTKSLISITFDELSVEEQIVLYEDIENEFQNYEAIYSKYIQSVNDLGDKIEPDLATNWTSIASSLHDRKILIDNLVQEKLMQTRINDLQQVLQSYTTWLDSTTPTQANHIRLSTELKIKMKTLLSHQVKINEFQKLIQDGTVKSSNLQAVIDVYSSIQQRLDDRQQVLENLKKMSSEEVHDIQAKQVKELVAKSKETLETKGKVTVNELPTYINSLKALQEELKKLSDDQVSSEFTTVLKQVEKEISEHEKAIESHNRWKEKLESLESWLDQVNVFIVAETPGVGDCDIIEAQLEQSNALQKDIETLEPKYNEIISEGKEYSTHDISVRARVMKLVGTWSETVRKAKDQNELLDDCAKKTFQVTKSQAELESWLKTVKDSIASEMESIKCETSIELSRLTRKYRSLSEQVDHRVALFKQINELSNDLLVTYNSTTTNNTIMMLQPTQQPGPINLAKSITSLNSQWNQVTEAVKRNFENLRDVTELYGEFRSLTATMTDSLDRLEKKIHVDDELGSGDMEELSMQIDDLDNTIPAIQTRLAQIQAINDKLGNTGLKISDDIEHIERRFESLHDKYLEKRSTLDSQVTALSSIESNLTSISKQIDAIVQDYHDESGGSVAQMKAQLESQLENLNHIKGTIGATVNEETRTRLELQRQQLESKLNRVKELGSCEIEDVSRQISCVEREYATLKSLKPQLEQILKEGRKKVGDDQKLSTQLDSIKGLYNQLGIQVSVIKNNLDEGLDLSTKIHTGIHVLRDFLNQLPPAAQLSQLNQTELQNNLQNLPNTKAEVVALDENIKAMSKLIDPILLQDLQETSEALRTDYTEKTEALIDHYKREFGNETKDSEVDFQKIQVWIKDLQGKIDDVKQEFNAEGCFDLLSQINDISEVMENLRNTVTHNVVLESDPFSNKNPLNERFTRLYDQFNTLSREVQTLENFEIHEDEGDVEEEEEEEEDILSDLQLPRRDPPSYSDSVGIVNPCFDEDDTNELNVTVSLHKTVTTGKPQEPQNIIEEEWNVAYTVSKSSDEDTDEEDEEENSRITVINTGKVPSSHITPAPLNTSKNVKIVEIRENEIVQGILRMEPIITETKPECKEYDNYLKNLSNSRAKLSEIQNKLETLEKIPEPRDRTLLLDELQENLESMILFISHGDSLSMKLSKEDLASAKAILEHNSKFKIDWSNTKSTIENGRMTCLWLETLILECQILYNGQDVIDENLKSKIDQLRSHGIPFETKEPPPKPPAPEPPAKPKKSEEKPPEMKKPVPVPVLSEDQQELVKLEAFIDATLKTKLEKIDDLKHVEISVSKMHRPTVKLLKNRNLPSDCLAQLDTKWKNLLEFVSKSRAELESKEEKPTVPSPKASPKASPPTAKLTTLTQLAPSSIKETIIGQPVSKIPILMKEVTLQPQKPVITPVNAKPAQATLKETTLDGRLSKESSPMPEGGFSRAGSLPRWVRQDPLEVLQKWVDEIKELLGTSLNITNEQMIRNHVSNLKTAEHQIIGKRLDAEKLDKTNEQAEIVQANVQELIKKLPQERQLLEQKLSSLRKLKLQLDTTASWILEIRAQLATAKYRSEHEKALIIQGVLTRVSDKEPEVHDVIQNYRNLQNQVENQGLSMDHYMNEKMKQLTEDWNFVLSQQQLYQPEGTGSKFSGKSVTPSSLAVGGIAVADSSSSPPPEPAPSAFYRPQGSANVFVPKPTLSTGAAAATTTTLTPIKAPSPQPEILRAGSNQNLLTPTLPSTSEDEIELKNQEILASIQKLETNMTLNLKQLKQQIVLVGDTEHIQFVLEKQKNVQTELELKRPQLDELMMTAENLKSQENRQQLYAKLTRLMDHWTETNQAVMGRLHALEECLHDSINWNCQFEHIQATLHSAPALKDEVMLNNFSDFLSLTSNLIVKYSGEDVSKLNETLLTAQILRVEWKLDRIESGQPVEGSAFQDLEGELNSMTYDANTTDETKQRWNTLRNRVVSMRSKISTSLYNTAVSQQPSNQPRNVEIELRELTEWVIRKEIQLPIINTHEELPNLENTLVNYIQELECKRPIIESCLRQHKYQQQYMSRGEPEEKTAQLQRDVDRLSEMWSIVCTKAEQLHATLQEIILKQKKWSEELDDCSARLATAEAIKSRWTTIAAAADKSSILDQLKTFREHIWTTNKSIQDLNTHFKALNLSKEPQRLVDLNNRLSYLLQDSPVPLLLDNYISHPWEKLHINGVPYYVNHSTETTQWDHPSMTQLLSQLTDFNMIRFSAYRTALKLRAIQKHVHLDRIPLPTLISTFENLGLRGTNDRLLDVQDMTFTIQTLHVSSESCAYITDMTINWILNVYDAARTGNVRNLSFKIGLVLLAKGSMEDKFRYLFRLVADINKTVDQRKLGLLLHDCMQIPRVLGEVASFGGSNIEPSVRSCFESCGDGENLKMNSFIEWTKQEPQSLVWLPVLHRVAASEGQSHNAKCNACKCVPIIGLRYRCLKCFNFDMCQKCFFSGKKSKSHKLSHPMQEYCIESTSSEDVRDFTRALKNKFKSKRKLEKTRKLGYLPVQSLLEGDTFESPVHSPQHSLSPELSHHRFVIDNNLAAAPPPATNGTSTLPRPDPPNPNEVMNNNRGSAQSTWVQNIHSTQTPESDDEHTLIAAYCQSLSKPAAVIPRSPIQVLSSIDADHSIQLESVIRSLEQENNNLQMEYNRLLAKKSSLNSPNQIFNNIENNNILNEARLLRVHKGRLEARMQILEEHNRQLEQQLNRLRQLLDEPKTESSRTGTLQSKSVVASELDMNAPNNLKSTNQPQPDKPSPTISTFGPSTSQVISSPEQQTNLPIYSKNLTTMQQTASLSPQAQVEDLLHRAAEIGQPPGNPEFNVMTDEEE
ncbi:unnamed protein product [Allacma fusca]|uniref:Dystrophin n=1 Tax=Allacma fusca TaxID=39272 RepID=A0A8J2PJ02_9HEXA|nr:unnamed protein product [Allacma fusca]